MPDRHAKCRLYQESHPSPFSDRITYYLLLNKKENLKTLLTGSLAPCCEQFAKVVHELHNHESNKMPSYCRRHGVALDESPIHQTFKTDNQMTKMFILLTSVFSMMLLGIPANAEESKEVKKCPVSGDALGGDKGAPVEVTYNGKTYMLCCKSCIRKFNANPEKFIKAQK